MSQRCTTCGLEIEDGGVSVGGAAFHSQCFVCDGCGGEFSSSFVTVEGKRYHAGCQPSHVEIMSDSLLDLKMCHHCTSPLADEAFVEAAGLFFHSSCFKCYVCGQAIRGSGAPGGGGAFEMHPGPKKGPCHESCAPQKTCATCNALIETRGLVIEDRIYHPDCLRCFGCGKGIEGSYTDHDGRIYHPRCVPDDAGHNDVCVACQEVLTNPAVEVEGKAFHRACFRCTGCQNAFADGELEYCKNGNDFFHKGCAK